MNFWFSFIAWVRQLFAEKNCNTCDQLRADLAYERSQAELFRNLFLEEKSKKVLEPKRSAKDYPFAAVGRGITSISSLKQRALVELEKQARLREKEEKNESKPDTH